LFYRLEVDSTATDVTINFSPTVGNANLYINWGANPSYPTNSSSMYATNEWSAGSSVVFPDQTHELCLSPNCFYIIGVHGQSACSFSIVATTSKQVFN
jgi:hypothetical protein